MDALRGEARSAINMYQFLCQKRANSKVESELRH